MSETEPKIIPFVPWWERDEELQAIAKKCDALFTYAGHTRPMCHCQDEGAIEEAYERGVSETISKMREKMKEVWEERDK
jgi:hypothetical protein